MSFELKNIIIAGATGSVGAPILAALLAEPHINLTILSRASSSATFPANVPVKRVSDAFTVAELTEAFKGQDAVVVALTTTAVSSDDLAYRLIDAAVAAGVKRFVPSEFGANNLDPRARKLAPVYDAKGAMREYLSAKTAASNGRFSWTSFSCGSWLDWALDPAKSGNFLAIDVKNRSATIYDSGNARFSVTTSTNTALAVVKSLLKPEETVNKHIFLSDFTATPRAIISALEQATGEKFSITQKESAPILKDLRERYDNGEAGAVFGILSISFIGDIDVGYDFEKEQVLWNEKLGLPKVSLEEVVEEAVALARNS